VRVKKTKPAARPIRYLLSADWGQHRISLKRISERITKATKSARSSRRKRARTTKSARRETMTIGARTMLLATIVALVATAALIAARQPATRAEVATVVPEMDIPAPAASAPALEPDVKPASSPRRPASTATTTERHAGDRTLPVEGAKAAATRPAPMPIDPIGRYEAKPAAEGPAAPAREPVEPATSAHATSTPVTIFGCVKRDKDGFWLKDTSGEDAPKSRNWKFGFLKKRSASVYLVDSPGGLDLTHYVGRRVAATGTMVEREMQPRSVRQVSAVCD
jgi:hypothetical protein